MALLPAGLWMSEESVGDAGASHLGYFTGRFSPHDGGALLPMTISTLHQVQTPSEQGDCSPVEREHRIVS